MISADLRARERTILVESLFKQRAEMRFLTQYPPSGYRFVTRETGFDTAIKALSRMNLAYKTHAVLMELLPVNLLKPYWERFKKLPEGVDLTYAVLHPVFRPEPWVLDMRLEQPYLLIGHETVFHRWKSLLRSALESSFCRRILFELETGRQAFLQMSGWSQLEPKMTVVHSAVPRRSAGKPSARGKPPRVRLLFVNSANVTVDDHFYAHGGLLAVETFLVLRRAFPNLELVVWSSIPARLRRTWEGIPNLRLIDRLLPWEELEEEFMGADIFLYPTHVTPSIVLLDAMSYGLPIVTTDVWGNPELVKDGHNGLLVHHSIASDYTDGFVVHFGSRSWRHTIESVDQGIMQGLVQKTARLIEDVQLRRRLGSQGRQEVEEGTFSIRRRNETLKRILDDAVAGA